MLERLCGKNEKIRHRIVWLEEYLTRNSLLRQRKKKQNKERNKNRKSIALMAVSFTGSAYAEKEALPDSTFGFYSQFRNSDVNLEMWSIKLFLIYRYIYFYIFHFFGVDLWLVLILLSGFSADPAHSSLEHASRCVSCRDRPRFHTSRPRFPHFFLPPHEKKKKKNTNNECSKGHDLIIRAPAF